MAQRIFIASDQLLVSHLHRLLERAGISALMQKSVVDVPQEESGPLAWYSELWVMQDRQLDTASRLLARVLAAESGEALPGREQAMPEQTQMAGRIFSFSSPTAGIA